MLHKKVKVLVGIVVLSSVAILCVQLRFSSNYYQLVSSRSQDADFGLANGNVLQYPLSKHLAWLAPEVHRDARDKEKKLGHADDDDDYYYDDDAVQRGRVHVYSQDRHLYAIDDNLIQEMSLSWILVDLGLDVRLNCRKGRNVEVARDDALLIVCLNSTHLTKEAMNRKLTKFEAKLLVLQSIFNKLGGNGTSIMRRGKKAGELRMKFDELVISQLASLIARWLQGGLELGYQRTESATQKDSYQANVNMSSQTLSNIDFEKELDLSFLHKLEQRNRTGDSSVRHRLPTEGSQKPLNKLQKNKVISEREETGGRSGIQIPQRFSKNFHSVEKTGTIRHHVRGARPISKKPLQNPLFISPSLMKLQGYRFTKLQSLQERGFASNYSFKSPSLMHRIQYITAAAEGATGNRREVTHYSLDANLLKRAEFQHRQVKKFCSRDPSSLYLPGDIGQLDNLFKHLLYDDKRRLVFCYVPKNGCSNMKRTFLVLNGYIPPNASQIYQRPPETLLNKVNSFRGLSREGALYRLNNYYKFAILRNPLERLLSAYRNKLEKPLNFTLLKKFPDRLKAYILTLTNKPLIEKWSKEKDYSRDIHPSFEDTLQFMTKFDLSTYNEHFLPFLELCHPCAINYDAFLNLKTLRYDIFALLEYLGIPANYYPPTAKSENTKALMNSYYKTVPTSVKTRAFKRLRKDLNFYYELHPEEKGMHVNL